MAMALAIARKALGDAMQPRFQQVRSVYVEVKGLQLDQALGRYGRKLRQDKTLDELVKKDFYIKPSEAKREAAKEKVKRGRKMELKLKLKLIAKLRALGL